MEGKDLTRGNLLKNMTILLIPLVLTNLLNSIYNIVDAIWIGNLVGENGVSAITNCYPLTLIVTSIQMGRCICISFTILWCKRRRKAEICCWSILHNNNYNWHYNCHTYDINIRILVKIA